MIHLLLCLLIQPPAATKPAPALPPYADETAVRSEAVTVGEGKWKLRGTLVLPNGPGPFPAVVLVHGSGPHDQDETIAKSKPFRDLALGLAAQGVAVLRYEKRTKAHSIATATLKPPITVKEEIIDDALAAIDLLAQRPEIDPKRIYLLGHSQGGMAAPRIAEQSGKLAGFISLAGNTRPLYELIAEQTPYELSTIKGLSEKTRQQHLETMEKQLAKLKSPDFGPETPAKELPLGMSAPYWISVNALRPAETAAKLDLRIFVLQGERDYQVTMADFAGWKQALAGKTQATFKSYPKLNHLFMTGEGKSTPQEYLKPGFVDGEVVTDIATWIKSPSSHYPP